MAARRLPAVKLVQAVQLQIQRRIISRALAQGGKLPQVPSWLRWLLRFRVVRQLPARLFGYGYRQEHVRVDLLRSMH